MKVNSKNANTYYTDIRIQSLVQLKDGRLASASRDSTVRIWEVHNKFKCTRTLYGHSEAIICMIQLKDSRLMTSSWDKYIITWDITRDSPVIEMNNAFTRIVNTIIQLKDSRIVLGSNARTLTVWDKDLKCLAVINCANSVESLIQLKNGHIMSRYDIVIINVYDLRFNIINTISDFYVSYLPLLQLRDQRIVLTCDTYRNESRRVLLLGLDKIGDTNTLRGHKKNLYSVTQLQDGRLVTGSKDETIRIWNLKTKTCEVILSGHENTINCLIQLKDGRLVSGSSDDTIRVWK
jgi:WD40 repeat protein